MGQQPWGEEQHRLTFTPRISTPPRSVHTHSEGPGAQPPSAGAPGAMAVAMAIKRPTKRRGDNAGGGAGPRPPVALETPAGLSEGIS